MRKLIGIMIENKEDTLTIKKMTEKFLEELPEIDNKLIYVKLYHFIKVLLPLGLVKACNTNIHSKY